MKVIANHTMQELDRLTIEQHGTLGLTLMENAGRGFADAVIAHFGRTGSAVIFAGKGNNGGDGCVIARLLNDAGWQTKVCVAGDRAGISGDAETNLLRLSGESVVYCRTDEELRAVPSSWLTHADLVIDALFGTGLVKPVTGVYAAAVNLINSCGRPVWSVDIPSGIHGTTGEVLGTAVCAAATVTFACAKSGHVLFPGALHTGILKIIDIGIPAGVTDPAPGCEFLDRTAITPLLSRRDRQAHKGHFGHCLIIAGSTGRTGAAVLAASSAVRAGSGLVTLAGPETLHTILEIKTTEAMTAPLPDNGSGHVTMDARDRIMDLAQHMDALAIGPGMGRHPGTVSLVHDLVAALSVPLVIDADGLNALAGQTGVLHRKRAETVILTPHPGEMARLTGLSVAAVEGDRIGVARAFAAEYGVFLILKGARTIIASPQGAIAINGSGNPGMASGGMGDVLTGIVTSLLGQSFTPWDACRIGVHLHGHAADLVAAARGEAGMTATDVLEALPLAWMDLLTDK